MASAPLVELLLHGESPGAFSRWLVVVLQHPVRTPLALTMVLAAGLRSRPRAVPRALVRPAASAYDEGLPGLAAGLPLATGRQTHPRVQHRSRPGVVSGGRPALHVPVRDVTLRTPYEDS